MARDWMRVEQGGDHYRFRCDRCLSVIGVMLPAPMVDFIDFTEAFQRRHLRCEQTLRSARLELVRALHRRANPGGSFTFTLGF